MEFIPQPNYCAVDSEDKKAKEQTQKDNAQQPMGVVPPDLPSAAKPQTDNQADSPKTSPILVIVVMILLAISSGLGYLIMSRNTDLFELLAR